MSPEAPPPVLTCTLKQTRNFSNKFRNNYLLVTYRLFRDPFNGEEEHKVPLFFAEKNQMPSGILIIKPFSTVWLITLFKANEVPMNHESRNRYFASTWRFLGRFIDKCKLKQILPTLLRIPENCVIFHLLDCHHFF